MDIIQYILTYVVIFFAIAGGINLSKKPKTVSIMLGIKGIAYFYLAIAIFVNVLCGGDTERYITGLTLGIAIIEGSTAIKEGIKKTREA